MRTSTKAFTGSKKAKSGILGLSAILLATTAAPAFAQEEAEEESSSQFSVSANAALVSDYRFRGVSFSNGDFAIQGGIDVSHDSGFYVGVWGSSQDEGQTFTAADDGTGTIIDVPTGGLGNVEVDLYGGWSGDVFEGLNLDVGLLYFWFPDGTDSVPNLGAPGVGGAPIVIPGTTNTPTDFFEPYITLTKSFGPVEANVGVNYAWDQAAIGNNDSIYIHGGLSFTIPGVPVTLNSNLGYTDGALDVSGSGNYLDWLLGADFAINDNLSVGFAYTDTDAPSVNDFTDSAFVFTLSASF